MNITLTNKKDGTPLDLTGATVTWYMKRSMRLDTNVLEKSSSSGDIELVDQKNGKIKVKLKGSDTQEVGVYYHYAWIEDVLGDGNMLLTGRVEIKER